MLWILLEKLIFHFVKSSMQIFAIVLVMLVAGMFPLKICAFCQFFNFSFFFLQILRFYFGNCGGVRKITGQWP